MNTVDYHNSILEVNTAIQHDVFYAPHRRELEALGFELDTLLFYQYAEDEEGVEWFAFVGPKGQYYEFERSDYDQTVLNVKKVGVEEAQQGDSHAQAALQLYREQYDSVA